MRVLLVASLLALTSCAALDTTPVKPTIVYRNCIVRQNVPIVPNIAWPDLGFPVKLTAEEAHAVKQYIWHSRHLLVLCAIKE